LNNPAVFLQIEMVSRRGLTEAHGMFRARFLLGGLLRPGGGTEEKQENERKRTKN
jgi:hypothetical protein